MEDTLYGTQYKVGDAMETVVMKHAFPQGRETYGLLHFTTLAPLTVVKSASATTAANRSIMRITADNLYHTRIGVARSYP